MPDNTFETTNQQQEQEVFDALTVLEAAESPEELYTILRENQTPLLTRTASQLLDFLIEEIEEDSGNPRLHWLKQLRTFLEHTANEVLQRGGSAADVRETYVNRTGGLTLDVPSWLEHIEAQLQLLADQSDQQHKRIALYRAAVTRALRDTNVAPETLASLQHNLGMALKDTPLDDPRYAINLEEALAAQQAAHQTFTFDRYPVQHAYVLIESGLCSLNRVEGQRSENIEYALACMQTALEVFQRETFPAEWGEIQIHSWLRVYFRSYKHNHQKKDATAFLPLEIHDRIFDLPKLKRTPCGILHAV